MQATPKAFRVNKGLSITEAAKLLNIKTSELRSIENDEKLIAYLILKNAFVLSKNNNSDGKKM